MASVKIGVRFLMILLVTTLFGPFPSAAETPVSSPLPTATATPPVSLETARIANEVAQAEYYRKQADSSGKKDPPWWEATLFSSLTGFAGAGLILVLTNRLSDQKTSREQQQLYHRQKSQVRLAVVSLDAALSRMNLDDLRGTAKFLSRDLLPDQPTQPPVFDRDHRYYRKYDLVSSIYRLCALLGWIELYRTDPAFLSGPKDEREEIESSFRNISGKLRDDFNKERVELAANFPADSVWRDGAILEDDQRAIGERMLTPAEKELPPTVIGYARFCGDLFRFPDLYEPTRKSAENGKDDKSQDHWIWNATAFLVGMGDEPRALDFRNWRLARLREDLRSLQEVLATDHTEIWFVDNVMRPAQKYIAPDADEGEGASSHPPQVT